MRVLRSSLVLIGLGTVLGGCVNQSATQASLPWWQMPAAQLKKTPGPGDLRAVQMSYPTGRFDPAWLVSAAEEVNRVPKGVPAGVNRLRTPIGPLALNPSAFTAVGPMPLNPGNSAAAGRTNDILVDPSDTTIAYIASDGGGVWKTTNCCSAATTWTVKTDFPELASSAIGDLAMDPNDPNVIYAGTGDLRYGSFSFGSAGVLRSADKGETWTVLGLSVFGPALTPLVGNFPQYQSIGKVAVDPNNSANLIVGTKTGLFVSNDTGATWAGPCYTNTFSTQRQDVTGLLAIDAGTTTELVVAIGTRGSPTPVQPDLDRNGANGVYRATLPATGCPVIGDWTLRNNNWPAGTGNGTTAGSAVGRVELAVAPTNNQVIYALVSDTNLNNGVLGVWKSTDRATTWAAIGSASAFGGCDTEGTQMWYDSGLTVDPNNENTVYASAVDAFKSTNGGAAFNNLTCGYVGGNVHVDHHSRAFVGTDSARLLLGSDGGVWYSSNATAGSPTFIPINNTLNTIEFYSGDITANFANATSPGISGGAQDNGSNTAILSQPISATSWTTRLGGDGIFTRIDPIVRTGGGQRWYYSSQNGNMVVAVNGPSGTSSASPAWSGDTKSFVAPFEIYRYGALDVAGSGCTTANGCTRLIAGSTRVWETITGGQGSAQWYVNSPTLTKNPSPLGARGFINQLTHAVHDPSFAAVATNDGNVQWGRGLGVGTANTATWVNLTDNNAFLPNRPIMDVTFHPSNSLIVYASVGGFDQNTPTTPGHVFQATCTANCASFVWADKTGNLPNIPVNTILANPNLPNQVFVGTDWGLYFTDDITAATPTWQRHEGLPHVMVWDMSIDRGFTTLAVFTRSRGAWVWPLPAPPGDGLFVDSFE
ncbi:hypothetical protein C7S18_13585 [Ahniella affigens]|uniref:Exo-alpha-sialidase n=1 Tax=Ahniella affigens TaxID=2021234 RepID=A0A2P1PTK5_9GAMM|nr:hypothetical protein [Ahniella affigens]AVP98161.1 hypothetical protein C7S18_13585 [Ahniella affigens]